MQKMEVPNQERLVEEVIKMDGGAMPSHSCPPTNSSNGVVNAVIGTNNNNSKAKHSNRGGMGRGGGRGGIGRAGGQAGGRGGQPNGGRTQRNSNNGGITNHVERKWDDGHTNGPPKITEVYFCVQIEKKHSCNV